MIVTQRVEHQAAGEAALALFAKDVLHGLSGYPKRLPSQYLYDAVGSALFDAITQLSEYGLTRADIRVLSRCAQPLAGRFPERLAVTELGSGSGGKTRLLLSALAGRRDLEYYPIDVSLSALERCRAELSDLCPVHPICETYIEGLRRVSLKRKQNQPILVLFLGSTIGNFHPHEALAFFTTVRGMLQPGDALLVGADLVKPPKVLLRAYDDPAGVTAAFNRNLLCRINRELGGNLDVTRFRHEARYSSVEQRVEMHLRSVVHQRVRVEAIGLEFEFHKGETIWTESSYKFDLPQLDKLAADSGFTAVDAWIDSQWPFAECLWTCAPERS